MNIQEEIPKFASRDGEIGTLNGVCTELATPLFPGKGFTGTVCSIRTRGEGTHTSMHHTMMCLGPLFSRRLHTGSGGLSLTG
jgi:hypothetical protein